MKIHFTIYKDRRGEWRWRAKRSGRIIADSGEGYKRKSGALRAGTAFCAAITLYKFTIK